MQDFRQKVRDGFENQSFMKFIGAEITVIEKGSVQIEISYQEQLLQQHGFFHGGLVATLADNVGGFAGETLMNENEQPLSIEFKINFINPARGKKLIARGNVIKNGRRIKVVEVNVYCKEGLEETHCAVAIVSVIATEQEL